MRSLLATLALAVSVSLVLAPLPAAQLDVEKRRFDATEDGKGVPVMELFAKGK